MSHKIESIDVIYRCKLHYTIHTHSKLLQITSELAAQLVLWYGSSEELRDT